MAKFTKKPVEIEARQFDGTQDSAKAMCEWMAENGCEALRAFCGNDEPYQVYISTLEGRMTASAGDWIIRGVKGEFYPCKPGIFELTYQPAALSHAAGQEGDDSLPRPLWPVSKEWYRLCERRFAVDRITISGKLAEAIVDAVCGPAIAAQRKEGV